MSSHFGKLKSAREQVIATLDNRNSLPFETEEEQEEAREFLKIRGKRDTLLSAFRDGRKSKKAREFLKIRGERKR